MAENVNIVIKAFDKTEAAFSAIRKQFARVGAAADKLKNRFPSITAVIGVMGKALKSTLKVMAKGLKSIAKIGIVAVAGLGYLVKSSLTLSDSLVKTSAKIGTTADALAGLRFAAELTGVETRTLDMAMQRFTRRTAEAAKGTGEAKGAIKELGIDAQKLNKMPLDERMLVLADAFSNVENESDRLRLSFKLFDSEGAALVNTLALGRDGLKEMLGEAKALGLGLSVDAAKGVEAANDEFTKLKLLFRGITRQVSAALAPALKVLTERFTDFVKASIKAKDGVENFARSIAVDLLGSIQVALQAFEDLANGFIFVYNSALKSKDALSRVFSKESERNARSLRTQIEKITGAMLERDKKIEESSARQKRSYQLAQDADAKRLTSLNALLEKADETGDELSLLSKVSFTGRLNSEIQEIIDSLGKVPAAIKEITESSGDNGASSWISDIVAGFNEWNELLPTTTTNIKSLTNQGLNGLTDALTAGVTGAAKFSDAMRAMAKSVVDSLVKMLIQKYIVDAAFGAITGAIGGGVTASTNFGPAMNAPNFGPQLTPKAIGGSVQNGQPYMVGERGPEMFVPNSQGSIVPNRKMGGGSGITINQTINVTTGVQQTVRAEIATLMPQIANAAKGAVADARMRGGSYGKMLGA